MLFITADFGVFKDEAGGGGHSFISFASQRNCVVIFSSSSFSFLNYHPVKAILYRRLKKSYRYYRYLEIKDL